MMGSLRLGNRYGQESRNQRIRVAFRLRLTASLQRPIQG